MQTNAGKHFLVFTKKERKGTFALLSAILLIFVCSKYVYPLISKEEKISSADITRLSDSLRIKKADSTRQYTRYTHYDNDHRESNFHDYPKKENDHVFSGAMFYFDPNTLDAAGWQRLGIRDKTIATIQNYIAKGGKFREPDDIRKVWGLHDDEKDRLVPYVRIAEAARPATVSYPHNDATYEKKIYEKKSATSVDINTGDSLAFVALPGIGAGYSRRIINFRDKLGGFYSVDQIAEVYGLPDSVFQKIKPLLKTSGDVRKININTASAEELKAHPYIRWQLANLITEYKKQHGAFKSAEDLKKIPAVDEDTYRKLLPYIAL